MSLYASSKNGRFHVPHALEFTAYKGIALQAVFGTMAITATMYVMYASRIIRPTPAFNKVIEAWP